MIIDAFREAIRVCQGNLLRSALGALAIAFAVATVGIVVSTLDGLAEYTRETTARAFGSDTFVVARIGAAGQISRRELQEKLSRNLPISRADFRFLTQNSGAEVLYAPSAQRYSDVVVGSRKLERVSVTGTTSAIAQIREIEVESGRFLQNSDEDGAVQVAFVGAEVATALFPKSDPVGKQIRIAGRGFQVVGVQARIGGSEGSTLDRYLWIPIRTFERIFGAPDTLQVFARPVEGVNGGIAEDRAWTTLRARRRLQPGIPDNFDILAPNAARGFVAAVAARVGLAALPISAMALLAAIIVVTNTTLTSISQRIREIGVRRAVGATRRQVVAEVISESVVIALLGGASGIFAAVVLVRAFSGIAGIEMSVRPETMLLGLSAAAVSGLIAGLYPALRASRFSVVNAIRAE